MKNEKCRKDDQRKTHGEVPFELVPEIQHGEHGKNRKRDDFLNGLELRRIEFVRADAVRGHLKAVFEESDAPAYQNYFPKCFAAEAQVPVPCNGQSSWIVVELALLNLVTFGKIVPGAEQPDVFGR
jgi:hypothetical protein